MYRSWYLGELSWPYIFRTIPQFRWFSVFLGTSIKIAKTNLEFWINLVQPVIFIMEIHPKFPERLDPKSPPKVIEEKENSIEISKSLPFFGGSNVNFPACIYVILWLYDILWSISCRESSNLQLDNRWCGGSWNLTAKWKSNAWTA